MKEKSIKKHREEEALNIILCEQSVQRKVCSPSDVIEDSASI
jgi:hypothetical protein